MRDEERFDRKSVHVTFQVAILINSKDDYQKKLDAGKHVEVFWKKGRELAWTFLNTMNNIHHCHTLHNNMSLDNVMLHFLPKSKIKVFRGICDWTMVGNFNDFKESFYILQELRGKDQDNTIQVVGHARVELLSITAREHKGRRN